MRFIVYLLINVVVSALVLYIFSEKFVYSNFFNSKTKCYHLKSREELDVTSKQLRHLKKKDGKFVIFNERYLFFDLGFRMPCFVLLAVWPLLYFFPNNILGWCFILYILIQYYHLGIVYLRFKLEHRKLLDKNEPYALNYTLFPLVINRGNIVLITLYVFVVFAANSLLALYVLIIMIIKIHLYIFIDKLDLIFEWDSLKTKNLERYDRFEYVWFFITYGLFLILLNSNPLNVLIY